MAERPTGASGGFAAAHGWGGRPGRPGLPWA